MVKYHINPETGVPNKCSAIYNCRYSVNGVPIEHYDSIQEAYIAYEKEMKNKTITTLNKNIDKNENFKNTYYNENNIDFEKALTTLENFKDRDFSVALAKDIEIKFYHDSGKIDGLPPTTIESYKADNGEDDYDYAKPGGVLWLSSGTPNKNNKILTSWRELTHRDDFGNAHKNSKTYEIELSPDTVIVELNEDNVGKINQAADKNFSKFFISGEDDDENRDNPIEWEALKNSGIDAVRINGINNNYYFHGYEVDSLIILNGEKVKGFVEKDAAYEDDDFPKEINENHPLDKEYNTSIDYKS